MSIQEVDVTLEELQLLDQDEILRLCKSPVYYELESAFGSIKGSEAAKLLSATCSMHLKPESSFFTKVYYARQKRTYCK
jgi:hypothetical protein